MPTSDAIRMTLLPAVDATFGPGLAHAADPPPPRPENVSTSDAPHSRGGAKAFHLPEGFAIELVAAEPDDPQAAQHRLR